MAIIGKRNTLSIVRESAPGLCLDGGELGEILLPGRYFPRFGASKGAFKQALGALFKGRRIRFTKPGIELLENAEWVPGRK